MLLGTCFLFLHYCLRVAKLIVDKNNTNNDGSVDAFIKRKKNIIGTLAIQRLDASLIVHRVHQQSDRLYLNLKVCVTVTANRWVTNRPICMMTSDSYDKNIFQISEFWLQKCGFSFGFAHPNNLDGSGLSLHHWVMKVSCTHSELFTQCELV